MGGDLCEVRKDTWTEGSLLGEAYAVCRGTLVPTEAPCDICLSELWHEQTLQRRWSAKPRQAYTPTLIHPHPCTPTSTHPASCVDTPSSPAGVPLPKLAGDCLSPVYLGPEFLQAIEVYSNAQI